LKALERKNRNMERAIGAPVIASAIVPIPPTSHSGSLPTASQSVPYVSQHQPRTFYSEPDVIIDQEPVTELIASNQPESSRISSSTVDYSCLHNPSPVSHPSQPHTGSSSQGRKRKDRSEAEEKREKKKRMCMKCGIQGCKKILQSCLSRL
jgi:hypothetical protein